MKKLLLFFFTLPGLGVFAQQDALFSQYLFNMLVINPGYSGSRNVLSTTACYRYQWVDVPGAPRTLTVSAHTPLRNKNFALGLYAFNDELGPLSDWGITGNFAYRIFFNDNNTLAFGIDAGIHRMTVDWSEANPYHPDDPAIHNLESGRVKPDANFGIYYFTDRYFIGASSKHLFESTMTVEDVGGNYSFKALARHFYLTAGVAFPIGNFLVIKPSALLKYTLNAPINLDVSTSFLISKLFWLGASYRTKDNAVVFFTEINLSNGFRLGYSYDMSISKFSGYNKGSHEIMLNYEFDIYNRRVIRDLQAPYF